MLTKDLIKPTLRQGKIFPRLLKASDEEMIALADNILQIAKNSIDLTFGEIQDTIDQLPNDRHRTHQAFWKILSDRSQWQNTNFSLVSEQRWQCFYTATDLRQSSSFPSPQAFREHVAEHLGRPEEELRSGLFADLPENQRLIEPAHLSNTELINLYNRAQLEGLLARARTFKVESNGKVIDQAQLAKPAQALTQLMGMPNFKLEAEILFGKKAATLQLDQKMLTKLMD